MPGYTDNYGFPYPLMLTETVDATAWQTLSNAIDAQMSIINNLVTQVKFPDVISVARTTNLALVLNTLTDITWDSARFQNPAGMWAAGATINIPDPGIYYFTGFARVTATTVTFNQITFSITNTGLVPSTTASLGAINHTSTTTATEWLTNATALVPIVAASAVKLQVKMNGTGAANVTSAGLAAVRLSLI